MYGVSFEVNAPGDFFLTLDKLMDVAAYDWYIDDVELNYFEFQPGKYSGKEFKNLLGNLEALSFVRIRRYPIDSNIGKIDTYSEFLEDNCDVIILFYDGGICEMFGKELDLINRTLTLCGENGFDNVKYFDNGRYGRTDMHF